MTPYLNRGVLYKYSKLNMVESKAMEKVSTVDESKSKQQTGTMIPQEMMANVYRL
jgi:hypothetical protein